VVVSDARPIHVLYENPDWLPPLLAGLEAEGLEHELCEVWRGAIDPTEVPVDAVYLNRMSPSSHTRGHLESVDLMAEKLAFLEHHGRTVVNGSRAFALEVSKLRQDLVLRRHGIKTPTTLLAVGRESILQASLRLPTPFITKHNQGGKGLGIHLFGSQDELAAHLDSDAFDAGPKGQVILQQYVRPREPFITRVELVDGKFLYAMRSDTSEGFELCPSDACQIPAPDVCPVDGSAKFTVSPMTGDDPLVEQYRAMCAAEGIAIAGIEYVEGADGERYTYDINGTTNYNSAVAEAAGVDGMRVIARYVKRLAHAA
jgi:RimK-like ATP-grasp domain